MLDREFAEYKADLIIAKTKIIGSIFWGVLMMTWLFRASLSISVLPSVLKRAKSNLEFF